MITLFTGMPGAGKTAALVDLLSKLDGDRPIYVHHDPAAKKRADQPLLHETLTLPHEACHATRWHKEVPDGSIIVIDEAQDVWRPRGPGSAVPEAIAALETHRHGGVDIYLTTQSPRLVDANVRGLIGRHVHIRDTGWLGRHWYEWPECNEAMAWKTCQNKRKYKLPKNAFGLFKSANLHTKPIRKTPLALYLAVGTVGAAVVGGVMVVRTVSKGPDVPKVDAKQAAPAVANPSPAAVVDATGGAKRLIDDRVDWVPRISYRPDSAPAYDELRVVVNMPRIAAGYVKGKEVRCYTQQGTRVPITDDECREWLANPPFDAFTPEPRARSGEAFGEQHPGDAPRAQGQGDASGGGRVILIDNAGVGARDARQGGSAAQASGTQRR